MNYRGAVKRMLDADFIGRLIGWILSHPRVVVSWIVGLNVILFARPIADFFAIQ